MIGIVLVTHGNLAREFLAALEHVVGPQQCVSTVCIGADDDMEKRRAEILESARACDKGDGVIVLTDMFERGQEFTRQIAVGNQYDTNHVVRSAPAPTTPPAASASRWERVTERPVLRNQFASSSATATER